MTMQIQQRFEALAGGSEIESFRGAFDRYNVLHVQWHLGNFCNYRCSYCNDPLRDGSMPFIEIEKAKKFVASVTRQAAAKGKRVEFTLSGGEPTVYKDLPELLEFIHEHHAFASVMTNGSRSVAYYTRIAPLLTRPSIFTFHSDHATLDHFTEVISVLDPRLILVYVPMNMAKWDICVEAVARFNSMGVKAIPKTVYENFGTGGANTIVMYSKAQRQYLIDESAKLVNVHPQAATDRKVTWPRPTSHWPKPPAKSTSPARTIEIHRADKTVGYTTPQSLILNKQNDFRGMTCNAGLEFLLVVYNGNVMRANCRPLSEVVGNVMTDPEFEIPSDPITCDVATCWCEADLIVNKYVPKETTCTE